MSTAKQKREIGFLDGTPDKRMYWSIISDYDIKTGICELIDNAIDLWKLGKRPSLEIELYLDYERQLIQIKDNAGGVQEADLRILVAPGASNNNPEGETIGIFGVGSKRAVIALAEAVAIKTRHQDSVKSFQIDITRDWLESPDWEIPHYEIPDIEPGVTIIDLSALRKPLSKEDLPLLIEHLGEAYDWFLRSSASFKIKVNGTDVKPKGFEAWAFPPGHEPRKVSFTAEIIDQGRVNKVNIEITAGLIRDRDSSGDNYGVYFYCNNRLIVKHLKVREVGYFVTSEAGVPHFDASLCRAIVRINGSAKLMPWNSSKSGINYSHLVFHQIRKILIELTSYFSSLSRRLKENWDDKVFRFDQGKIQEIVSTDIQEGKKIILPPLPKVYKFYVEMIKDQNIKQIEDHPWTLGLVESVAAVDIIRRQKLESKNRIALILLDSCFEIALKEFIVHRTDLFPNVNLRQLFGNRDNVIAEVVSKVSIDQKLINKAKHYYGLRNKLIHERATADILPSDIDNYRGVVQQILHILFDLNFS